MLKMTQSVRLEASSERQAGSEAGAWILRRQVSILFFFFFNVDHFKSLYWICYNIASFAYVLVFWHSGMWTLRSLTRDGTCTPCIGRWSPNPRTSQGSLQALLFGILLLPMLSQSPVLYRHFLTLAELIERDAYTEHHSDDLLTGELLIALAYGRPQWLRQ